MMDRSLHNSFRTESAGTQTMRARLTILGIVIALLALPQMGSVALRASLRYERDALAAGQWWRLVSAHFVHLDLRHLVFNILGLMLLWLLFVREYRGLQWLGVGLCSMLAVDAGLWLGSPQVIWYVGASGVLHGLWSAGAWAQWRRAAPATWLPLVALLLKLGVEQWRGVSVMAADMQVVLQAHVYGALGGLLLPLAWQLARPRRAGPL